MNMFWRAAFLFSAWVSIAEASFDFSTAGFDAVSGSPRTVASFNPGWRFHRGEANGAHATEFNDSSWSLVNLPHTPQLLPLESSGGANYQGPIWYRKTFHYQINPASRPYLHFEAIMGRCTIWVNGKEALRHTGGYLPIHLELSDLLKNGENLIAIWATNANDGTYPPGKPQEQLDFAYYGGIYRDAWFVERGTLSFTDPAEPGATGYRFTTASIANGKATLSIGAQIVNRGDAPRTFTFAATLTDPEGRIVIQRALDEATLAPGAFADPLFEATLDSPKLWTPDSPNLYKLMLSIHANGQQVDAQIHRVGIRTTAFSPDGTLLLNGTPLPAPLIGGNRHQDFAHIGNALSNSLHYRDALLLRQAGMRIIRSAHYPQDPAFLDACDALGLFVISATPGWQYWSNTPAFADHIYSDIRHMVLRDRNRPSLLFWEPILNETHYPAAFAQKARQIVIENLPPPYTAWSACDANLAGAPAYEIIYRHPTGNHNHPIANTPENRENLRAKDARPSFTREFGDNVDDWNSHNSPSRVLKQWGEIPQLTQALHYTTPSYLFTSLDLLYRQPPTHFGGTLWHPFDHGRGYHPDNFYGGILDATRQPKYAYHAFKAALTTDPFIFIAHELTPFSPPHITCFSNCDEIRLTALGKPIGTRSTLTQGGIPHAPVTFENAYSYMALKALTRGRKYQDASIIAEGLIDGKVVARAERRPAYRPAKLHLTLDAHGLQPIADGSDLVTLTARLSDKDGSIKRLDTETIRFTLTGPAEIVDDGTIHVNPQTTQWGEATILLRMGTEPGAITVTAALDRSGSQIPRPATLTFHSHPPAHPAIGTPAQPQIRGPITATASHTTRPTAANLAEVERQQAAFE